MCPEWTLSAGYRERFGNTGSAFPSSSRGAALVEGAPAATEYVDVWIDQVDDERLPKAAAGAGISRRMRVLLPAG